MIQKAEICSQSNILAHVLQRADTMQNITDAGLVPGRKQSTMGIDMGLQQPGSFGEDTKIYEQFSSLLKVRIVNRF